jgi:SAM-dependent methyltransferase
MGTHIFSKYHPGHDFGGRKVLNIGCGFAQYKRPNVINVDAFDICKPDVVWDLNKTPFPFKDASFDHIIANHIMEHLPNWWGAFNECARLLKPNGVLEIWVPGSGSDSVFGYRDHVVMINNCGFYGTFGTYRNGSNAWARDNARCDANRLKSVERKTRMIDRWWINRAPVWAKRWYAEHLRNVIVEDGYFFRKVTEAEYQEDQSAIEGAGADGHRDVPVREVSAAGL